MVVALGLVGVYLGISGYLMAGSFSVSHPDRLGHWHRMAYVYLGVVGLSLVGIVAAGVALLRKRRRGRTSVGAPSV
jgi:hypothetical protein